MADVKQIRRNSLSRAQELGYHINPTLPLLDIPAKVRGKDEIADRMLGMLCVAASVYSFDRKKSSAWIKRELTFDVLTDSEKDFLRTGKPDKAPVFEAQIEGMWALAWCLSLVSELDFSVNCSDDFVFLLPDLKVDESSGPLRKKARMRETGEILAKLDLSYCLDWAIADAHLHGKRPPGVLHPTDIAERRRALEWVFSEEDWDNISLDT
jgi:hypothetical protein